MTQIVSARQKLVAHFLTGWGSETPITFENEDYDPPENVPWVRLSVRHFNTQQTSIGAAGNRRFESPALAIVQVYTAPDIGLERSDELVQLVRTVFQGQRISGTDLVLGATSAREVGETDGWFQVNAETPVTYLEVL